MPSPPSSLNSLSDALNLIEYLESLNIPRRAGGFNREAIRKLEIDNTFIPTSTLYFFLDFAFEGNLPAGGKTILPLISEDEVPLLVQPYSAWAPAPWNRTPSNLQQRLMDSRDGFHFTTDRRTSFIRARLWHGLVPMSGARWKEKRLDDPENWKFAFEFLHASMFTFVWLGSEEVSRGIKNQFNRVAKELETFQHAINSRRERNGVEARVDMTGLWLEFVTSVFETMVTRTHSFILDRVNEIIERGRARYAAIADERGAANCVDEAKKFGALWSDLSRLLHMADFTIMMPMDGFTGFVASNADSKVVGSMSSPYDRQSQHMAMKEQMAWPVSGRYVDDMDGVRRDRAKFEAIVQETKDNHVQIRRKMRGEPKALGREHWISIIKSRQDWSLRHGGPRDQRWGFVAYMLTHKPSKEEWEAFKMKAYADFAKSGEWVEGFEDVKQDMDLQWIDAKDVGIPHDDIEAAKRHFTTFIRTPNSRKRVWFVDFLVVDSESFASYMSPPPPRSSFPPSMHRSSENTNRRSETTNSHNQRLSYYGERTSHGDYGGFFKLIDNATNDQQLIAETAPGFKGELKVLGTLIFDDLYPLLVGLVHRPRDFWTYACWHPNQVYVGPTVDSQENEWELIWKTRGVFWRAFWKWRSEQGGRTNITPS